MSNTRDIGALWDQSVANAKASCSWPWVYDYETPLNGTSLSVHHIFMIVVGVAAVINISIASYLLLGHLSNWTRPHEQRQYTRIILFPIILSITSFLGVVSYHAAEQIVAVGQLYEGIAIVSVFLLYVQLIAPNDRVGSALYEIESENPREGRTWKMAFQIVPVRVICFIAIEALYGAACPIAESRKKGRTIITVIVAISTVLAMVAIIMFQRRHNHHHKGEKPLMKLLAFKAVIALQITQSVIFTALSNGSVFIPSAPYHVSYNDLARGLPQVLFTWELVVASVVFLWAFNVSKFRAEVHSGVPKARGIGGALWDTVNPSDIVQGIIYSVVKPGRPADLEASNAATKTYQQGYNGR